jgi:molybdenum storage protein
MTEAFQKETLGRSHVRSRFMQESLVSKRVMNASRSKKIHAIIPDAHVVMIGGKSIFDRGRAAVFPLVEEIKENRVKHKMIFTVSGGVRMRHTFEIGMDLGLPTGGLAMIAGAVEEQNAAMLYALLANHGGINLPRECFKELPLYLQNQILPILVAMPPHHFWEKPPAVGMLPEYGPDFGTYMIAEVLSTKSLIYVKDQDGLFSENPDKNPAAKHIPRIQVEELLKQDLADLPIERSVLHTLARSQVVKQIHLINGLKKGELTRALNGEDAGTVIYR